MEIVIDGVRTVAPNHYLYHLCAGDSAGISLRSSRWCMTGFIFPKCRRDCRNAWIFRWIHFFTPPAGIDNGHLCRRWKASFSRKSGSTRLIMLKMTELFIKLPFPVGWGILLLLIPPPPRRAYAGFAARCFFPESSMDCGGDGGPYPLKRVPFYTVYKSFYGTSPVEDLIRARIDSAKMRFCLRTGPYPPSQSPWGIIT